MSSLFITNFSVSKTLQFKTVTIAWESFVETKHSTLVSTFYKSRGPIKILTSLFRVTKMVGTHIQGTFYCTRGQDFVDFFQNTGMPQDQIIEIEKLIGAHFRLRLELNDTSFYQLESCDELESFKSWIMIKLESETEVYFPVFGGNCTVSFKAIGSHIIHGLIKTKDMKEYEVWNMFHENELMQKIIHKRSGSTYTNLWKRRIQTNLWFKFCRAENLTEFYQELSVPKKVLNDINEEILHFEVTPTCLKMLQKRGTKNSLFKIQFGTEATYNWEELKRKVSITQIGPQKFLKVLKGFNDEHEEWTLLFTSSGLIMDGLDVKSGQHCQIFYKHASSVFGPGKMIANSGLEDFGMALSMPKEVVEALKIDFDAIWTLTEEQDGLINYKVDSSIMPKNITYEFGQEFDDELPGLEINFKVTSFFYGS